MGHSVTPIHVRSGYSLLRGTALPRRLIDLAGRLGHRRLALTDVNNLYGATVFHKLARDAGLAPIAGAELIDGGHCLVALIADKTGYENLCRIITRIHRRQEAAGRGRTETSRASLVNDVAELSEGLHVILEDDSLAARLLAAGMSPKNLWLGLDPATQSRARVRRLAACAARMHIPLTATAQTMFAEADDHDTARLLAAIRGGLTYQRLRPDDLPHVGAHLRSPAQLQQQLAAFGEAIRNNQRLAEECSAFTLLPRRAVFPDFPCPQGMPAAGFLRHLCRQGMRRRYGRTPPGSAESRLAGELALIDRMGFSEYFLVVWDIVQYARRMGAPVAGRGSGASSLAAYLLGITNVCPIAFGIPFERFLHEGREDFPDLDVDFCWRIRDDVIEYAFGRWGEGLVAMVSTHNTFQAPSALRETAKAFGLSNEQVSRLSKADFEGDERLKQIARFSRRILNLPRNLSVHPGGIVIGRKPIDHYVPVQRSAKGVMITQYDKDGIEDIRLVKLDLLGNRSLSTIRSASDLIRRRRGVTIDIESIPPADPATIALLQNADTVGCNQLESPAMRHLLRMIQPADLRDIMKVLALIRPGAASIGMKEVFVRRHRGLERVPAGHPRVDAILRDTHGVMLYEDDVMLVAAALLGCDLAEADRFRKAVQKCRGDEERLRLSRELLARCRANGTDVDYAKSTWVQMAKFNAYSFCRAHAASYALPAYGGAYLRAHYPLEFWTAALNNNQSMYHPRVYVEQAKREGIRFLPPDVNRSAEEFDVEAGAIRIGLNLVGGLGPVSAGTILQERAKKRFEGVSDFLYRTGLGRDETKALILCGAFDGTGRTRPTLMMELNLFLTMRSSPPRRQATLLEAVPAIPNTPGDYSDEKKYFDERRILGISAREHLMKLHRSSLAGRVDTDSRQLPDRKGKRIRIAGFLEAQRTTRTQTHRPMMFLTLEDELGLFEITVFPDTCRRIGAPLKRYGPYIVTGKAEEQYGAVTVSAQDVKLFQARTLRG